MLDHAQVVRVHDIGAAHILLNGVIGTGALLLHQRIAPSARLRAIALVARTPRHGGRQHAAPRKGHAHGAMYERLDLKIARRLRAQLGDILHAHLTRDHHARCAQVVPGARSFGVHHGSLRAHMQLHMRGIAFRQGKRTKVADDERVGARGVKGLQIWRQGDDIGLAHKRVHRHVHLYARHVRKGDGGRDIVKREVLGTLAHTEPVGGQIYRIRPETNGGLQLAAAARRRKKLDC